MKKGRVARAYNQPESYIALEKNSMQNQQFRTLAIYPGYNIAVKCEDDGLANNYTASFYN